MINPIDLLKKLQKNKIDFFTGVPDSVLKSFIELIPRKNHYMAQNEGSAISLATGFHLSTKKIGLVYLQNSGLGNSINPLTSIVHKEVYSIPLLLLIGWRGSPNSKDEPQHLVKGKITIELLKLMKIKYIILDNKNHLNKINGLINYAKKNNCPVALLIKNNFLEKIQTKKYSRNNKYPSRSFIITNILKNLEKKTKLVVSTGYNSREVNQIRKQEKLTNGKDFYLVGGMGHTSNISLGISLKTSQQVVCLDGDGAMLMHLGGFINVLLYGKKNFKYVLLNNNCHESVGSQKTFINNMDIKLFSKSLGFKNYFETKEKQNFTKVFNKFYKSSGPSFLNVFIKEGSIKNLSRPKNFLNIKKKFQNSF